MDENEIKIFFTSKKSFRGVYAINELPGIILENGTGIIVNTSERRLAYGHWVTIYKYEPGVF